MWIQLLVAQHVDLDGIQKTYHPGDWLDVGRQTALRWVDSGAARPISGTLLEIEPDCGIVVRGKEMAPGHWLKALGKVPLTPGALVLKYPRTLLLSPPAVVPLHLVACGFRFVQKWDLAVPMMAGYPTAADLSAANDDLERTTGVIHDLRVPLYDTRVVFARQGGDGAATLERWREELANGGDERLAFLRAVYTVKPLLLPLPQEWVRER